MRRPGLMYVNARVAVLVELVEGDMVDELNGGEGGMTKLMWMGGGKKVHGQSGEWSGGRGCGGKCAWFWSCDD